MLNFFVFCAEIFVFVPKFLFFVLKFFPNTNIIENSNNFRMFGRNPLFRDFATFKLLSVPYKRKNWSRISRGGLK